MLIPINFHKFPWKVSEFEYPWNFATLLLLDAGFHCATIESFIKRGTWFASCVEFAPSILLVHVGSSQEGFLCSSPKPITLSAHSTGESHGGLDVPRKQPLDRSKLSTKMNFFRTFPHGAHVRSLMDYRPLARKHLFYSLSAFCKVCTS